MLVPVLFVLLALFVIGQLRVLVLARCARRLDLAGCTVDATPPDGFTWPAVAVQLPVYREDRVLPRLLAAVTALDYPPGRLSVQVLDDSEGDLATRTEAAVAPYRSGPVPVSYVRREGRAGYKSGALNHGTTLVESELVAIFDADFVPDPGFLRATVPLFGEEDVGAVHTRWRHRGDDRSALTGLQAAILDALFCFESAIRQVSGESSMYLGTAGVWRTQTIEELGGWREAPFTDDGIDLSFRARIAGWRVVFVNEALASGDLPETFVAWKNQQRRWARAAFRVFLDFWRHVLRPPERVRRPFLELSSLHLVLATPALLASGLLTAAHVGLGLARSGWWIGVQAGLTAALVLFPAAQEAMLSQRVLHADWADRCRRMLPAWPLAIGVAVAILAGFHDTLTRDEPEFVRTPKGGASGVIRRDSAHWLRTAARTAGVELGLGALLAAGALVAVGRGYPESWLLLFGLAGAFLAAGARSWTEIRQSTGAA